MSDPQIKIAVCILCSFAALALFWVIANRNLR